MRRAYTLLEILIATTILVIGLGAVFGVTQSAQRKSVAAAELATVQLACQTALNERLAGQESIRPFAGRALGEVRHWTIALAIYPSPKPGLHTLHLIAQKHTPTPQGPLPTGTPYHLLRWVATERVRLPDTTGNMSEGQEFDDPYRGN